MDVRFTRTLRNGDQGIDVEGVGRALSRAGLMGPLSRFVQKPSSVRRTFGMGKTAAVKKLQAQHGKKQTGVYGPEEHAWLEPHFDAYAEKLMLSWVKPTLVCFPFPLDAGGTVNPNALHVTAGIPGNWALDFMGHGGTPVVAVEDGWVARLSGRDPAGQVNQSVGIFGWSISYETRAGYRYFSTHYGARNPGLYVGMRVEAGDHLGRVGSWPGDPGRSHLHLGVTSPFGERDARKRIQAVASAPRVD